MAWKRWRCVTRACDIVGIITKQPKRKCASPFICCIATRPMQNPIIKCYCIPWFHCPFEDFHCFSIWIWNGHIIIVVWIKTVLLQPTGGQDWLGPFVTARHAAQRGGGHRIQRAPKTDILNAIHEVIRRILVPGGWLGRAGFFDQNMFMKHLHPIRTHQVGCNCRGGALSYSILKFWYSQSNCNNHQKNGRFHLLLSFRLHRGRDFPCCWQCQRAVRRHSRRTAPSLRQPIILKGFNVRLSNKGMRHFLLRL